jgi:aldehyde dehydrogenase (NAD+)
MPSLISTSPQQPTDVVAEVSVAPAEEVQRRAETARAAQREWWAPGVAGRSEALRRVAAALRERAEDAAALVTREVGKPAGEATGEVTRTVAILEYYAQACFAAIGETYPPSLGGQLWTERRPHGVAGLITPWNFPLAIPIWKAAPALAVGNAVLWKPSPEAVGCAELLGGLLHAALPDGLVQIVHGEAETGEAVVAAADVVSFTGSVAVGREVTVAAARDGRPVQAEMGGQNAAIVLPDADLDRAAATIASAAMGYAGQKCTATRRVIAVGDEARRGTVEEAVVAAVRGLRVGDPAEAGVVAGPVITDAARSRVLDTVDAARGAGADVLAGGAAGDGDGWFVGPAVLTGAEPHAPVNTEETFGPLITLLGAADVTEAVDLANAVRFGLVTSVHGSDSGALLAAVAGIDTGLVKVNAPTSGVDFYAPFGGEKASSYGPREQGTAALGFYTSTRTVTFAPEGT